MDKLKHFITMNSWGTADGVQVGLKCSVPMLFRAFGRLQEQELKFLTHPRFPTLLLTSGLAERPSIEGRASAGNVWKNSRIILLDGWLPMHEWAKITYVNEGWIGISNTGIYAPSSNTNNASCSIRTKLWLSASKSTYDVNR